MARLQIRRGPSTGTGSWATANPVLASGEFGFETDTKKFKIGDGTTAWNSLGYAVSGAAAASEFSLTAGAGLTGTPYNGSADRTFAIASSITTNVTGTLTGNASTATTLATARTINGASFNGSANVIVGATVVGATANASATFGRVFVSQTTPTNASVGDVWINWA